MIQPAPSSEPTGTHLVLQGVDLVLEGEESRFELSDLCFSFTELLVHLKRRKFREFDSKGMFFSFLEALARWTIPTISVIDTFRGRCCVCQDGAGLD